MVANGNGLPQALCAFCEDDNVHKCIKCQRFYCILHTSRISPNLCQECFKGLEVIYEKCVKTSEDYDVASDTVTVHKTSCDQIRLDGPNWVWYRVWSQQLTEQEQEMSLEFHKFMVSLLENVRDVRKVQKNAQLREEKVNHLTTETTVRTKTKKVLKQQKDPRAILLASGIKEDNPLFATLLAQMQAK